MALENKLNITDPAIYEFAGKVRDVYMKGIDNSYLYEGYSLYKAEEL